MSAFDWDKMLGYDVDKLIVHLRDNCSNQEWVKFKTFVHEHHYLFCSALLDFGDSKQELLEMLKTFL